MQTFLPYPDFKLSLASLDSKRLGKQRVEAKQILLALEGSTKAWAKHPCTQQWKGYEGALVLYGLTCCYEWLARGYQDSLESFFESKRCLPVVYPWWVGVERYHISHQSNLVRKLESFYKPKFNVISSLPYLWPDNKHHKFFICLNGRRIWEDEIGNT